MTTTGCLIPRRRLQLIPHTLRLRHEFCFFLHDECARLLTQYEDAQAHIVTIQFEDTEKANRFSELADQYEDSISALRKLGYQAEARRVTLNTITMAMVSDCLHHIYEALSCLERRKLIVALNLLRKPLLDSATYLSWLLGDEDAFYSEFMAGDPKKITHKILGSRRSEILSQALRRTQVSDLLDATSIKEAIFDVKNDFGLYGLFQHAVHLVTTLKPECQTTPRNFNFIFKDPTDDDVYLRLYGLLPELLLYLGHVILELFDNMKQMDEGAKKAFFIRSTFGFHLINDVGKAQRVREKLQTTLSPHFQCNKCSAPLSVTQHNAARIVLSETFRCTRCGSVHPIPFSWLF